MVASHVVVDGTLPNIRPDDVMAKLPSPVRSLVEESLRARLSYIDNVMFDQPACQSELFDQESATAWDSAKSGHGMDIDLLKERPAPRASRLSTEQERRLFLRYNYARRRTALAVAQFRAQCSQDSAWEIALWHHRAKVARDLIVHANTGLVWAMARRLGKLCMDVDELISEGYLVLLRAIDRFDAARGFKFSTYACGSIRKVFYKVATCARRHQTRFPAMQDPMPQRSDYQETRRTELEEDNLDKLRSIVKAGRSGLSGCEWAVIQARFGISRGPDDPGMTLEQVAQVVDRTKERVRQIQNNALAKLRVAFEGRS